MATKDDRSVAVGSSAGVEALSSAAAADPRPLIMHVVYRFGVGGLENGLVNLLDRLPAAEFRHAIMALTDCDANFCRRIQRHDVQFISLHKPPGHGWRVFRAAWRIFRRDRPAIVHTRNLAALEMQLPAWAAGVPVRLHGEHGRDAADPDGTRRRYRLVRRVFSHFVTHYVVVSGDLEHYLIDTVGVAAGRVSRIRNGVDERRFSPAEREELPAGAAEAPLVVGTVGRLERVKDQGTLVAAVARLLERYPDRRQGLRVRIVGDGPLRAELERAIARRELGDVVRLDGERDDVAELMRTFDVFVLPSRAEGISNTILEAMASAVPIVATAVGGNMELVTEGRTGLLVPASDPDAMADAIAAYLASPALRREHGKRARDEVAARFTLSGMAEAYRRLYTAMLAERPRSAFSG